MPINPDAANGEPGPPTERSWTSKDALLYAVGVGAGSIDPTGFELEFTTENSKDVAQRVLPTYAVIVGGGGGGMASIGSFNPAMLVHGGQQIELHREIPTEGTVLTTGRVLDIYDKGNAAVVWMESNSVDKATGELLFTTRNSAFIRGEGGWGGDRGPSGPVNEPPAREPDHVVTYQTRTDQALTYRLSGDRNPLHSDPEFAKMGGFDKPILHGLCTFGFMVRHVAQGVCGGDAARVRAFEAQFRRPVWPGETLVTEGWLVRPDAVALQVKVKERDEVVIAGAWATLSG